MPQETKAEYDNPRSSEATLQGLVASREDENALLDAMENAFDYRGDVTITRTDDTSVEGYIFDRRRKDTLKDSTVRLMTKDGERVTVAFSDIAKLEFTGKDTAAGKSFEKWVERYVAKKSAGEEASIESEELG